MVEGKKFVTALWLDERYAICKEKQIIGKKENWMAWKNRKSLLNDEDYAEMFRIKAYDECTLSAAISSEILNNNAFSKKVENQDWFILFKESIEQLEKDGFKEGAFDCYIPVCNFLEYAERKISCHIKKKQYTVNEDVIGAVMRSLFMTLVEISHKTIVFEINLARVNGELEAETSEQRYLEFFENMKNIKKILSYYEKYPVLARLLSIITWNFINNMCDFLDRYFKDYQEIFKELGIPSHAELKEIKAELGDTHEQGKSVFLVTVSTGESFLYKPKNLEVAVAYNQFCDWLNKVGNYLHIKTYKILPYQDYTYEEFIEQKPCTDEKEIREYFRNFGKLAAVLYYLRGNDFHMENIIACGKFPVVVDLETLLQQRNKGPYDDKFFVRQAKKMVCNYVGRTALFPTNNNGPSAKLDLSAFSGDAQQTPFDVEVVKNIRTDEVHYDYEIGNLPKSKNQPQVPGEKINGYNYVAEIIEGFELIMNLLIDNKEELLEVIKSFENKKIRMLVRSTMNYGRIMGMALHPTALKDSIEREKIFENMWHFSNIDKRVHVSEVRDMLIGDIPIFYANTTKMDVYDAFGNGIADYYDKTGYQCLKKDTIELGGTVRDRNISIIRLLTKNYNPLEASHAKDYSLQNALKYPSSEKEDFLEKAKTIGDYLIDIAVFSENKEQALYECLVPNESGWSAGISGANLYDGLAGVQLFMSQLYKVTFDSKYREFGNVIGNSIENICKVPRDYSVITGEMSWLSVAVLCYDGSSKLNRKIVTGFEEILNNIDKISRYDWIGGISSVLQLAIEMWRKTRQEEFLSIIKKIAQHLISETKEAVLIGGFSHGVSSLAYLMGKLYSITGERRYYEYCLQFVNNDNKFLNNDNSDWYDGRHDEKIYNCHWCHGALGIGLSRILLKYDCGIDNEIINADLARADKAVMGSYLTYDDTLCHGNAGKVEYFLTKYAYTGNENDYNMARKLGTHFLSKTELQYGQLQQLPVIGIFTGITGIGYEMLRLADCENVPSVLILQ